MEQTNTGGPRIIVLADHVAKIIAAGEVIDRPFSVVRELLDNSLDAGANEIALSLERGGIGSIRVSDNGSGMNESNLALCYLPHATSKIVTEDDLYKTRTLGFRGEALSSIGTCSHLEITSARESDSHGHRLVIHGGKHVSIEDCPANKGTQVAVSDLFFNMPARKKFLKTASGEQSICRSVLLDKALPFVDVTFRFFADNDLRLFLPKASAVNRIYDAYKDLIPQGTLSEATSADSGFSICAVLARPEITRKDRKLIQIFVNKRRIFDYSLVQAIEYGFAGYIPGKDNPIAFVFIDIDPGLVDFNVHPAKKECRFRNLQVLHQAVVRLVKGFASGFSISMNAAGQHPESGFHPPLRTLVGIGTFGKSAYGENIEKQSFSVSQLEVQYGGLQKESSNEGRQFRYLGQAFNLFLIAECADILYLVDAHAAHEKLLFEKFKKEKSVSQELLFPFAFEATAEEKEIIRSNAELYEGLGIRVETTGSDTFEITALPEYLVSGEYEEIAYVLKSGKGELANLSDSIIAMASCRAAIKEGEKIDPVTAVSLLGEAFGLANARCPHGRPIWFAITKDELYTLLGRK